MVTEDRGEPGSPVFGKAVYAVTVWLRGESSVFRRLRELRSIERWSTTQIQERQRARLGKLLTHVAGASPYYRDRWREAGVANDSDVLRRLAQLPIITKTDVQQHHDAMLCVPRPRRVTRKTTGGSTGQAVSITKDRAAIAGEMAASWLGYGWFGVRIGDRAARFWGQPVGVRRRLRFAAADLAMNRVRFSAFAFGEQDLARYWERCRRFQPRYMYGYVSMLEAFARFVAERGLPGAKLQLKCVITTAEVLTAPQRALISDVFGCAVQNEYGCGEVGPIAYECERGSLHLMSDNQYVEFLRDDGAPAAPGESGHIVLTDLNNHALPLIRYRVGDLGVPGEGCACGRGFPVMEKVWGREYDFVVDDSGRRYHGEYFMYLFEDLRRVGLGAAKFKVTQRAVDELLIEVVRDHDGEVGRQRTQEAIAQRLPGFRVDLREVAALPPRASGKTIVVENAWLRGEGSAADVG